MEKIDIRQKYDEIKTRKHQIAELHLTVRHLKRDIIKSIVEECPESAEHLLDINETNLKRYLNN